MSGHLRWNIIRSKIDPLSLEGESHLISYTEGYILACEDVIKDIDTLSKLPEIEYGLYGLALRELKRAVERSLAEATRTLEVLTK